MRSHILLFLLHFYEQLMKDSRMKISTPFVKMHSVFNPRSRAQIAPNPSGPGVAAAPQFAAEQDLLGLNNPALTPPAGLAAKPSDLGKKDATQDMIGLFQGVSVSNPSTAAPSYDPFAAPNPTPGNQAPVHGQAAQQYHAQAQGYPMHQNPNQDAQGYPPQQQVQYPPGQQQAVYGAPPPPQQHYQQQAQQQQYHNPQQQQQYQQQQAYQQAPQRAPSASNVSQFDPFK
jgi:hypothetical protein